MLLGAQGLDGITMHCLQELTRYRLLFLCCMCLVLRTPPVTALSFVIAAVSMFIKTSPAELVVFWIWGVNLSSWRDEPSMCHFPPLGAMGSFIITGRCFPSPHLFPYARTCVCTFCV